MDFEKIKELVSIIDASSLKEFEYKQADAFLRMSKNEHAFSTQVTAGEMPQEAAPSLPKASMLEKEEGTPAVAAPEAKVEGKIIYSPLVGVVYLQSDPESDPYVTVGETVKAGQVVCLVEAMKIMNEIKSELNGTVAEIFIENEQVVEFNQPLFRII